MDERIETIRKEGSELLAEYLTQVTSSSLKFVETLLGNVTALVRGVIEEGVEVAATATAPFLPEAKTQDELDAAEDEEQV
ncbi:MAG: hypothetical protein ACREQ9_11340 [Candidatus Binatia bacterium]